MLNKLLPKQQIKINLSKISIKNLQKTITALKKVHAVNVIKLSDTTYSTKCPLCILEESLELVGYTHECLCIWRWLTGTGCHKNTYNDYPNRNIEILEWIEIIKEHITNRRKQNDSKHK